MTFEDWLRNRGLSDASVKQYSGALEGVLSDWAKTTGLVSSPLSTVRDSDDFAKLAGAVQELEVFVEKNARGHNMYRAALSRYSEYLEDYEHVSVAIDIDRIIKRPDLTETEKSALIKTRVGHGPYRDNLVRYWGGCAVTGYPDVILLTASHIKPWRVSTNQERVDHFNGLLLIPNLDLAFDTGMISFEDSGEILISSLLKEPKTLCVDHHMNIKTEPSHYPYLHYHRSRVFRG